MAYFHCISLLLLQELKAFRSTLNTEQWQKWLNFAREEKQKIRARKATSPKSLILTTDPEQLLQAIMKTEKVVNGQGSDSPVHEESPKDIPHPVTEHIPVAEDSWSHNMHVGEPHQDHKSKERSGPPLQKSSKRLHTIPAEAALPPEPIHVAQEVRREPSKWELRDQSDDVVDRRNVVPSPHVSPRALYAEPPTQKPPTYASNTVIDQRDSTHGDNSGSGVSLELGIIRRNSRGRASSTPRERNSGAPHTVPSHGNVSFDPRAMYSPAPSYTPNSFHHTAISGDRGHQHAHSPKLKHSRQEDFFGGRGHQSPPSLSPPSTHHQQRQYQHQHMQHQYMQNGSRSAHASFSAQTSHAAACRARGPRSPEIMHSYHESRAGTAGPYSSRTNYPTHGAAPVLDLADAAEIARSTAFRLDSAYSAAQCLLSSISAEHAQGYLATGGRSIVQTPAPVAVSNNPIELEK